MANTFEIDIPMKDHPMAVVVKSRDDESTAVVYDLFYCDQLCGCIFKNEHSIWIYEPHQHAGLLLGPEQIQHLGKEIDAQA
ncbi:hypothetical protein HH214_00970 [Mucilaginibacter robiniae]|uniref:Uncharacterized protein n=1 Tax=Mucilaginibacter robiniae TaxID=2728022 RepID=A0A7L5E140_9SPHI|nr:hypothetical protein [Mucilaginibacter robiniae]QJD94543.1 hypothetical protein HH214_00970 [Mucilaginibacter robiniae]